jgi:hypothetical protein
VIVGEMLLVFLKILSLNTVHHFRQMILFKQAENADVSGNNGEAST